MATQVVVIQATFGGSCGFGNGGGASSVVEIMLSLLLHGFLLAHCRVLRCFF